jgi:hypothetical protein
MVAVGFDLKSMEPILAKEYSETFPEEMRKHLNALFARVNSSQ